MKTVLQFFMFLAGCTDSQLIQQVQYLKAENQILRSKLPKRITVTPEERSRLLKLGRAVGQAIKHLVTIVTPRTFARWLAAENPKSKRTKRAKPGRPRIKENVREIIVKLGRENGWGLTRVLGELKKLAVRLISRSSVRNILREHHLDPGPKRGEGTWADFLHRHAATLWACDFFSKKVWTLRGLVDIFVLFFIHLGSRRVHFAGMTAHPDGQWMAQQARNVALFFADQPQKPTHLIRDFDGKFTAQFNDILKAEGIETVRVGPRKPNLNAVAERFVQSIKSEALNHFICFGEAHLRHIISSYVTYYNTHRPHQGVGNVPLSGVPPPTEPSELNPDDLECDQWLGGLLKSYRRRAA